MINKTPSFSKHDPYYYINCNVVYFTLPNVSSYFKHAVLNASVPVSPIFLDVSKLHEIVFL